MFEYITIRNKENYLEQGIFLTNNAVESINGYIKSLIPAGRISIITFETVIKSVISKNKINNNYKLRNLTKNDRSPIDGKGKVAKIMAKLIVYLEKNVFITSKNYSDINNLISEEEIFYLYSKNKI